MHENNPRAEIHLLESFKALSRDDNLNFAPRIGNLSFAELDMLPGSLLSRPNGMTEFYARLFPAEHARMMRQSTSSEAMPSSQQTGNSETMTRWQERGVDQNGRDDAAGSAYMEHLTMDEFRARYSYANGQEETAASSSSDGPNDNDIPDRNGRIISALSSRRQSRPIERNNDNNGRWIGDENGVWVYTSNSPSESGGPRESFVVVRGRRSDVDSESYDGYDEVF